MKAREIIPGWPRGRSTTTTYKMTLVRMIVLFGQNAVWAKWRMLDDPHFKEDLAAELAEEARKARMMQRYYDEKMCEAMGDFVNDIRCPWNPTWPDAVRRMQPIVKRMAERERQFWQSLLEGL